MRTELEISLLINRYIENDLGYEEKLIFEKRLSEDASFREEFELQKITNQVVIGASEQVLREKISADLAKLEKRSFRTKTLVAASILLLVSAGLFMWLQHKPENIDLQQKPLIPSTSVPYNTDTTSTTQNSGSFEKQNTITPPAIVILSKPITDTFSNKSAEIDHKSENKNLNKPSDTISVSQIESQQSSVVTDPCKAFVLESHPKITNTCFDRHDGKIDFSGRSSFKGGKAPYLISRDNGESFKPIEILYGLSAGSYHVVIKDANGCLHPLDLLVSEKECKENKFAFNPDFGETWKVPTTSGLSFSVLIYGRSKELVFKHASNGSDIYEWSGININGTPLESGLYAYIIEYENGTKEYGQVSIIR